MTTAPDRATWIVVGRTGDGILAAEVDADGAARPAVRVPATGFATWAAARESAGLIRWVWSDTASWYPQLLEAGVTVARCHDLRLCHAILRDSALVEDAEALRSAREWDAAVTGPAAAGAPALFDWDDAPQSTGPPQELESALAEFARQRDAVTTAPQGARLRLIVAAESAGALVAAELRAAGLPWDVAEHDRILAEMLGEKPAPGRNPAKVEAAAQRVRAALGDPAASLDSQPKLLRSLHRVGVLVESTSRWELAEHKHPVIEPLLEYKKLSRLLAANGWNWLDEWVEDGRFRPVYVPAGVVTGRWASSGGGALQLPRQLRAAVRADPGWSLVVADVAQLEPRVLAGMARDEVLAAAARGRDLYSGVVESGAVATRAEAKVAMLGAMYGATTGDSGRLLPRLRRTFPRAMAFVDDAAQIGSTGGVVTTWLGRSSPAPSAEWHAAQGRASDVDASAGDENRARRWAGDRGRFTRNFVVQGTAAEWALAWLAELRLRLATLPRVATADAAPRSGIAFERSPHLAFFLHDEIVVHTPTALAEQVADAVRGSAASAGRLLFGDFPIDFPLELRIAQSADKV